LDEGFTTGNVLAMSFVEGQPIESLVTAPQVLRDRVMATLIGLVLRELFEFGVMQTDPNFANYRFQPGTGRLVLLDFGATRAVSPETASAYRRLMQAGLDADRMAIRSAAVSAGFIGQGAVDRHGDSVDRMIDVIVTEMHRPGPFDFGDRGFVGTLRDEAVTIMGDKAAWHVPPTDLLFVQRKISGMALLAARLGARVDVRALVRDALGERGQLSQKPATSSPASH
jgi:predicted unusual protein kinase regulating ubiquinone biosynthesis (AarF/ABC1/UbiB family)